MKISENGRSMIEMLGVLSIVGVISVGGFSLVSRSLTMQRNSQIIADTASLATSAKKLSCQYDSGYTSYTSYLVQSEEYPTNFTYDTANSRFVGVDDVTYTVDHTTVGVHEYYKINVGALNEDQCIRMATSNWGTPQSSGFMGLAIGASDSRDCILAGSCSGSTAATVANTDGYPMSTANAATHCSGSSNVIHLWYKGCH
ncbi:MAG: hypothetical protein J6Y91_04150 [Alphaproteobacteria bacterium]|nr:hypothetical protein [Alphaproteobacteria bacterium]